MNIMQSASSKTSKNHQAPKFIEYLLVHHKLQINTARKYLQNNSSRDSPYLETMQLAGHMCSAGLHIMSFLTSAESWKISAQH
jgi:hypothetical protein